VNDTSAELEGHLGLADKCVWLLILPTSSSVTAHRRRRHFAICSDIVRSNARRRAILFVLCGRMIALARPASPMKAHHIVTKISAVCLLFLTAVPFTAPFPACDLAALFAPSGAGAPPPAADTPSQAAAPTDSALSRYFPASGESGRFRLLLVSGAGDTLLIEALVAAPIACKLAGAASASSSAQRSILRI
jgi:hypothetical protein